MTKEEAEGKRIDYRKCAAAGGILAVLLLMLLSFLAGGREEEGQSVMQKAEEVKPRKEETADEEAMTESPAEQGEEARELPRVREVEKEAVGIDVSRFQEEIDWPQVAEAGIEFAMIRIGCRGSVSGAIVEDDKARSNLQGAADSGIYAGAYFFSTAVNEAEVREEAEWVCEFLREYPIVYPVVYNCEGFQDESSRQYGMTAEERTELAKIFLEQVEEAGYRGMFYASAGELKDWLCWNTEELEGQYKIWVAYYPEEYSGEEGPAYEGEYDMWQYTDEGVVPGIRTVVDRNVAYFGYELF